MTDSVTSFAIGLLIAMAITLAISYPSWLPKQVMLDAAKSGIIGLAIGLAIIVLVVLNESATWTIGQVLAAVAMASFFGPFGTELSARRNRASYADADFGQSPINSSGRMFRENHRA